MSDIIEISKELFKKAYDLSDNNPQFSFQALNLATQMAIAKMKTDSVTTDLVDVT